jgi:hypothetical protein
VDARLDDMVALIRDVPTVVAWIRRQRDWLFRTNHAWEPVFGEWAGVSPNADGFFWKAVEKTYGFLAPRFMSYQEWAVVDAKPKPAGLRAKVW